MEIDYECGKQECKIALQAYHILHCVKTLHIEYEGTMLTNHIEFEISTLNCEWAMLDCSQSPIFP